VFSESEGWEKQVVPVQVPVKERDVRKMTTRGGRDSMNGSEPVGRDHGVQGSSVGAGRSGCLCSGDRVG
jgi:hypothetical protein